jgi:hypothetical protein
MLIDVAGETDLARRMRIELALASREASAALLACWLAHLVDTWLSQTHMDPLLSCTASQRASQSITW